MMDNVNWCDGGENGATRRRRCNRKENGSHKKEEAINT